MAVNKVLGGIWMAVSAMGLAITVYQTVRSWDWGTGPGKYSLLLDLVWLSLTGLFGLALYKGSPWARLVGFVVMTLLTVWGLLYLEWREFPWFWFEYVLYPLVGMLVIWTWWLLLFHKR